MKIWLFFFYWSRFFAGNLWNANMENTACESSRKIRFVETIYRLVEENFLIILPHKLTRILAGFFIEQSNDFFLAILINIG